MGYSGLIYAAIVAAWAAYLVPRWIRRNEEIERAREADKARGIRVLARDGSPRTKRPPGRRSWSHHYENAAEVPASAAEATSDLPSDAAQPSKDSSSLRPSPAQRRRRMLLALTLVLVGVMVAVILDRLPTWAILIPGGMLVGFVVLARRAVVAEAERQARRRRALARQRSSEPQQPEGTAEGSSAAKRIAVLDEPETVTTPDPGTWEPVAVPLPTYLTKPKAPSPITRKIDLSKPGAWTSGRLDEPPPPPIPRPVEPETVGEPDLPPHRRAVGD